MLAWLFIIAAVIFTIAYFTYGNFLSNRVYGLDDKNPTPAHTMQDGVDYVPAPAPVLLGHHFSSIAGAGPIVGPIAATMAWGWLPAYLWIVVGSIFIGGVHDMSALVASIRHQARSIAELGTEYITSRAGFIFRLFIWLALVYVVAVFINVAQITFNAKGVGGGVAMSALIYIILALIFGVLLYRMKQNLGVITTIFVILVYFSVWLGQKIPINLSPVAWDWILLAYVFIASVTPVWILLQPRDYLSSFLLYGAVLGGGLGILIGGFAGKLPMQTPGYLGYHSSLGPMIPLLFVVIACGSISGFHSLVGSGTTSKQLNKETDAQKVGYAAMLLEGMVAVIAMGTVAVLTKAGRAALSNNAAAIYGHGIGTFVHLFGIPLALGSAFGMLALSSFVLTSTDTATRLSRYVLTELTGIKNRYLATAITLILPAILVFIKYTDPKSGKVLPVWKAMWPVFGATNQLIAALVLFVVMVWLMKTNRKKYWAVPGIPAIFMAIITIWALFSLIAKWGLGSIIGWAALVEVILAIWIFIEGIISVVNIYRSEGAANKA